MRVCVLRAPGTNCDVETAWAFDACGAVSERLHLFRLLEEPGLLADFQVLCIPGGFSYGDDVGAGVILSRQLRGRLGDALGAFLERDTLALGICNGFQTLLKSGLLPNGTETWPPEGDPPATLTWNTNGRYTAAWTKCRVEPGTNCVFLRGIDTIDLPFAHAEGRIAVADDSIVPGWSERGNVALRYADANGHTSDEILREPANPNGSVANVAGLTDPTGRVLGLMPHPERFVHATQHPHWTRLRLEGAGDGLRVFQNAVDYFA